MKRMILTILLATMVSAPAVETGCTVARVIDGDTFVCTSGIRVRLWGINAPELRDVGGYAAKTHLHTLIYGKMVIFLSSHGWSWDRRVLQVGLPYSGQDLNGTDVAAMVVQGGYATCAPRFTTKYCN